MGTCKTNSFLIGLNVVAQTEEMNLHQNDDPSGWRAKRKGQTVAVDGSGLQPKNQKNPNSLIAQCPAWKDLTL